jgi:hypothetical protein
MMLDSTELIGYLQWEGLAIFIGLYRPIATGLISLMQASISLL